MRAIRRGQFGLAIFLGRLGSGLPDLVSRDPDPRAWIAVELAHLQGFPRNRECALCGTPLA
jgi:hypothetical protein